MVAAVATFGGGSVELQALRPDQMTWMSAPTALKLTANGMIDCRLSAAGAVPLCHHHRHRRLLLRRRSANRVMSKAAANQPAKREHWGLSAAGQARRRGASGEAL
jgi:hypothetical protein